MSKTASVLKPYTSKDITLQEELAEVYFPKKLSVKRKAKKNHLLKNSLGAPLFMAIALSSILLLAGFMLAPRIYHQGRDALSLKVKDAEIVGLLEEGRLNRTIIRLPGDKKIAPENRGDVENKFIPLGGRGIQAKALPIDFKSTIDISGKTVALTAKGRRGGEAVSVAIRDSKKRSYRFDPIYLGSAWSTKRLSMAGLTGSIDLTRVEHIKVEYDDSQTGADKRYEVTREAYIKSISPAGKR